MRLGLLSDTHGSVEQVETTRAIFESEQPDALVHTGDVTRVEHIQTLLDLGLPFHLVFGNCDYQTQSFQQAEGSVPLVLHGSADILEYDGKLLGMTHGHYDRTFDELREENPDYIVHGHTHERRDEEMDDIRYINPGSVKPPDSSVAILDTETDELKFLDV